MSIFNGVTNTKDFKYSTVSGRKLKAHAGSDLPPDFVLKPACSKHLHMYSVDCSLNLKHMSL